LKVNRPSEQCGNFDELKSEGVHEKPSVATWNLETISVLDLRQRKTKKGHCKKNLERTQHVPITEISLLTEIYPIWTTVISKSSANDKRIQISSL
jgi:hypothetical protein